MLWLSNTGVSFALNVWFLATAWLVFSLTDSQLWVGIVGGSAAMSGIALSLVGGAVTDRSDRRRLLAISLLLFAACAAAAGVLDSTSRVGPVHLLGIALLIGAVDAFSNPAYRTMVVVLVGPFRLTGANAVSQIGEFAGEVVAPLFVAVLIATRGTGAVYFAASGVLVLSAIVMILVRNGHGGSTLDTEALDDTPNPEPSSALTDLREGFRYAAQAPAVLPLLALSSASIFGAMVFPLLPVYAREELQVGVAGFGVLSAAIAAGMAAGALSMAAVKRMPQGGLAIVVSHLVVYGSMAGFAVSRSYALSVALLFALGVGTAIASNLITTALQGRVADHVRGRVMSMFRITESFEPLGLIVGGAMAVIVGNSLALLIGAAAGTTVVVLLFARSHALRTLRTA
jgi:MFS family permease